MNDATGRPAASPPTRFALGKLVVDLRRRALLDSSGAPVDVRPQVWAVLEHLALHAGCVVTKDELLGAVWPGLEVTDGSVMQAISDVRALLGDTEHRIVKTMPRRGYMLLADGLDDHAEPARPAAVPATSNAAQALTFRLRRDAAAPIDGAPAASVVDIWPQQRRLRIDGVDTPIGGRAFDLLVALIERRDRVVDRSELFDIVWPGRVVEDNNLAAQVLTLRKLLGADVIATVPGRGYRFTLVPREDGSKHEGDQGLRAPTAAAPAAPDIAPEQFGLPAAPALFGREDDLEALQHLLAQHRHVSVLGAGGIGKTVLALAAAHARRGAHRDGAAWVDLSSLSQPSLVPVAVAQALHLPVSRGERPIPALIASMRSLDVLLLLDNAEHLVDAVAPLADAIAAGAPGVRLLVTSQVALKAECEHVFRLGPLAVPEAGTAANEAISFGAVALFVDQARKVDRRFELSDDNVAAVIELCRQLDGLALALKLAAGRVAFFGLRGLTQRIAERLKLLAGNSRSAPTRQQTLRAALDWSYGLLSPEEQATFRRLGVFAGGSGFSLELAKMVASDDDDVDEWRVIEHVAALVDRSLVAVDAADQPRYRLLESAREYALAKLDETGELQATQQRLARAMLAVFKQYVACNWTTSDAFRLATYAGELDNLRTALDWSARHDPALAVELLGHAGRFHLLLGLQHEHRRCAVALEPAAANVSAEVAGRYWLNRGINALPSYATAVACARKAIAICRSLGNQPDVLYMALLYIGWWGPVDEWDAVQAELDEIERAGCPALLRADRKLAHSSVHAAACRYAEALEAAQAGLALARSGGWRRAAALHETAAATAEMGLGQVDQAVRRVRALIEQERKVPGGILERSYGALAKGLVLQGDLEGAREALAELFRQVRLTEGELFPLIAHWCARLASGEQRYEAAARLMGFVDAEWRRNGIRVVRFEREVEGLRATLEARFDRATLERLANNGASMDHEAVFALTLERSDAEPEFDWQQP